MFHGRNPSKYFLCLNTHEKENDDDDGGRLPWKKNPADRTSGLNTRGTHESNWPAWRGKQNQHKFVHGKNEILSKHNLFEIDSLRGTSQWSKQVTVARPHWFYIWSGMDRFAFNHLMLLHIMWYIKIWRTDCCWRFFWRSYKIIYSNETGERSSDWLTAYEISCFVSSMIECYWLAKFSHILENYKFCLFELFGRDYES